VSKGVYIVHQAEGVVLERLGKFHRVLNSGLSWGVPFIDSPRSFTWRKTYIDANKRIKDESLTCYRIDLRENVFNFTRQEVYTKDTILLDVNSLMFYRIVDMKKAIYEIDDLQSAIINVAQTQLKEVFGSMTFSQAMESQELINKHMMAAFGPRFRSWGIKVERMELLDMQPKQGATYTAMKKQMKAERDRRKQFIEAEGKKTAMNLIAQGRKCVELNIGIAEQESTRKRSEGKRDAQIENAAAESRSLDIISNAMTKESCSQSEYMIAQQYLELVRDMGTRTKNKTIYLPYQVSYIDGIIKDLPSKYGNKSSTSGKSRKDVRDGSSSESRRGNQRGDFADLE
jgi:regulator of protease activity HflC (stomatin/prohibitin superfamily)